MERFLLILSSNAMYVKQKPQKIVKRQYNAHKVFNREFKVSLLSLERKKWKQQLCG